MHHPHCRSPGKHPIAAVAPHGYKNASIDETVITTWWTRYPYANIGLVTGRASGIVVVDVDGAKGRELLEQLLSQYQLVLGQKFMWKLVEPMGVGTITSGTRQISLCPARR
jgi:hypothetical protein